MGELAVHFQGVSKRYPHFLLDRMDLQLPTGTIMGFIGANGAGKSTAIRILMGLVHQDQGQVNVLGHPMPAHHTRAKWDIGFVSEDMRLYGQATLEWHMQFIQSMFPNWDQQHARDLLKRFDLKPQQKMRGMSHGQRVKATLLLALARRPKLLVLDEPTTGLDPVARHEVLAEMMAVLTDEDRTILFSSHNTADVEHISDQITFIDQGHILESQNKEDFLDRWKRLRLEVPYGVVLPQLAGVLYTNKNGQLAMLITNTYHPSMTAAYHHAGATVHSVEAMTLEEIFVFSIQTRRQEAHT